MGLILLSAWLFFSFVLGSYPVVLSVCAAGKRGYVMPGIEPRASVYKACALVLQEISSAFSKSL